MRNDVLQTLITFFDEANCFDITLLQFDGYHQNTDEMKSYDYTAVLLGIDTVGFLQFYSFAHKRKMQIYLNNSIHNMNIGHKRTVLIEKIKGLN